MKIFIIGASGRMGSKLMAILKQQGHQVSGSYNQTPVQGLIKLDLREPIEKNIKQLTGYDVIYFAAGSGGDNLIKVDLYGAIKAMAIAEAVKVKRFVLISSASVASLHQSDWYQGPHGDYSNYNIIKYVADEWLMNQTQLPYTIVRPGVLLETPATGKVSFDIQHRSFNSIEDVALVAAEVLRNPATIGQALSMGEGSTPIAEAVTQLNQNDVK